MKALTYWISITLILIQSTQSAPAPLDELNINIRIDDGPDQSAPQRNPPSGQLQPPSRQPLPDPKCGPKDSAYALYLKQQGKTDAEIAELDTDEARRERFKNESGSDGVVSYEEFLDDIKRRTNSSGEERSFDRWAPNLFKLVDLDGDGSQTYEEIVATRCKAFTFVVKLKRSQENGYLPYEDLKCRPKDNAYALYLKQQGKTDAEIAELDTDEARRERFKNGAGSDGVVSYEEFLDDIKGLTYGSGEDRSFDRWAPNLFKLMDLDGDGSQTYEEVVAARCKVFIFVVKLKRSQENGYRP